MHTYICIYIYHIHISHIYICIGLHRYGWIWPDIIGDMAEARNDMVGGNQHKAWWQIWSAPCSTQRKRQSDKATCDFRIFSLISEPFMSFQYWKCNTVTAVISDGLSKTTGRSFKYTLYCNCVFGMQSDVFNDKMWRGTSHRYTGHSQRWQP